MQQLFDEARRYIPGGVDSPVRAFRAVGGTPVFFERGAGPRVQDASGREFIDYVGSWGPLIAGHAHPQVVDAITRQAGLGTSFGAPSELETVLARMICERVPACERVRFVSSGTEASMSAVRLARGASGRDEIVKIDGCYHGHVDSLLVQAGSGVATLSIPGSPGIPEALAKLTHVVPFNDAEAVVKLLDDRGDKIACLILEPIAGNMGVIPPEPGYLAAVREATRRHGVVLILDEVMTGFRVHRGGAQALYDVEPDLSCFGKVIGGGLPAAAYGGRAELMNRVAPDGPVYQAGTLSGNPLAMCAGIETLKLLDAEGAYEGLERRSAELQSALAAAAAESGCRVTLNRVGSMLTLFFVDRHVRDFGDAKKCDTERFAAFFREMLSRGIYLPPSQFESWFLSLAHGEEELAATTQAARASFASLSG